jgi:hypothetical protein
MKHRTDIGAKLYFAKVCHQNKVKLYFLTIQEWLSDDAYEWLFSYKLQTLIKNYTICKIIW